MLLATPTVDMLRLLDCRGIHNFSYGSLDCYFWLEKLMGKDGVKFIAPGVLQLRGLPGRNTIKTFVYDTRNVRREILLQAQAEGVVYSIDRLPLDKETKFTEMQYDLDDVFNPENYDRKKRKDRLRYPFNWLEARNVQMLVIDESMMPEVRELHEAWVKVKLDDPKTFQMMFPNKRYLQCVERALKQPERYIAWAFYLDLPAPKGPEDQESWGTVRKLCAVQVYALQGYNAFGMAGFGRWWDMPSNSMNYMTVFYLSALKEMGYKFVNDGYTLNKRLHAFKAHYPHSVVVSYAYGKLAAQYVAPGLKEEKDPVAVEEPTPPVPKADCPHKGGSGEECFPCEGCANQDGPSGSETSGTEQSSDDKIEGRETAPAYRATEVEPVNEVQEEHPAVTGHPTAAQMGDECSLACNQCDMGNKPCPEPVSIAQEPETGVCRSMPLEEKSCCSATSQAEISTQNVQKAVVSGKTNPQAVPTVKKSAKAWIRELLSGDKARFTLEQLVELTGCTTSNLSTALSDLRSEKYCGAGGPLNIKKDSEKRYYVED